MKRRVKAPWFTDTPEHEEPTERPADGIACYSCDYRLLVVKGDKLNFCDHPHRRNLTDNCVQQYLEMDTSYRPWWCPRAKKVNKKCINVGCGGYETAFDETHCPNCGRVLVHTHSVPIPAPK